MKSSPGKHAAYLIFAALFLVPVVISPSATFLYSVKPALLQVFGFAVLAAWLSGLRRKKESFETSMPDIPVLIFLIWTGLSAVWAQNKYLALEQLVFLAALISIYYVISKTDFSIKKAVLVISTVAGIISIYGIFQFLGYDFLAEPHSQPVSTLGNVNFAGEFIAPAVIITAALLLNSQPRKEKILLGAVLILQFAYLLITRARGAWVGFFAGVAVFFILAFRQKAFGKKTALYFIAAVIAAALFLTLLAGTGALVPVVSEAISMANLRHPTVQVRLYIWDGTLRMIRDNLFLGIGPGNYENMFPPYRYYEEFRISGGVVNVNSAHNDFLETAAELGVTGLGIFAWILASAGIIIKRRRSDFNIFESAAVGMLACILVSGLFGFPLRNASTALLFWAGLGFISRRGRSRRTRLPEDLSTVKTGSLIMLLFVLAYSSAQFVSDIYTEKGRRKIEAGDWISARDDFEKSLKYYYPNIRSQAFLAGSYFEVGDDLENAYFHLKETLGLNPNHHAANYALGRVYWDLGRKAESLYYLRRGARINPRFYSHLGRAYFLAGDIENAFKYITKQFELGFADELSYLYLGELYESVGETEKAVRAYRGALEKNPRRERAAEKIRMLEATPQEKKKE